MRAHLVAAPVTGLRPESVAMIGVPRPPDLTDRQAHLDNHAQYGKDFAAQCLTVGGQIGRGELDNVEGVWDVCRTWRAGVAKDCNDPAQAEFAKSRVGDTGNSQTPIGSDCEHLHARITDLVGGSAANIERKQATDGTAYDENAFQRQIDLGNGDIGLTLMAAYTAPNGGSATVHDPEQNSLPATGRMVHTRAEHIPALLGRAQELFAELTTQSMAKDDQMLRLGEMHWMLAQAMPDRRGSAAKSEMVVRSLAHALGHDLPPLRDGVSLDIEAFFADSVPFQLDYADYFEHEAATGGTAAPADTRRSGAGRPSGEAWFTEMDL